MIVLNRGPFLNRYSGLHNLNHKYAMTLLLLGPPDVCKVRTPNCVLVFFIITTLLFRKKKKKEPIFRVASSIL